MIASIGCSWLWVDSVVHRVRYSLAHYGEHAVEALRRLDTLAHTGDIAVISIYDPETGEIAAFEELIGAHGGLGGAQTRPFLLHPSDWKIDQAPLVGAPMVYRQLRLGMEQEMGFVFGPRASESGRAVGSSVDAEIRTVPAT